jgi:indolepyruvate ferredoxin oxidoreductase beta subunit
MKFDIVLAGVGGQGVLSLSGIIAAGALEAGLFVKQSEVHGMAQRGGAVTAHLRLGDRPVESDLVPLGGASMILSLEPLESLRYLEFLSPSGTVVTAVQPVKNIPDYPAVEEVLDAVRSLPGAVLVDATAIAKRVGLAQATNMVMAGAASPMLPVPAEMIEGCIRKRFARKGSAVIDVNIAAFRAGREISAGRERSGASCDERA